MQFVKFEDNTTGGKMRNNDLKFHETLMLISNLTNRLNKVLDGTKDEHIRKLVQELNENEIITSCSDRKGYALKIAFVGQYNAGKSTIITALTGRDDIPIDGDVCTSQVTAYDWNGVNLLDTPGIRAGYPDHDAITYDAIDKADLLVYAVTSELFDPLTGKNFKELCFDPHHKAPETILVVNKMSFDAGGKQVKLPDIEKVTGPLSPEDFRTTFIDAEYYLESLNAEDQTDRQELYDLSNIAEFIDVLNRFISEKGYLGRITSPLFVIRTVAEQAKVYLTAEIPEYRGIIEILNRKRGLILESRMRLHSKFSGLVNSTINEIVELGDRLAEAIEPGVKEKSLISKHKEAIVQAENSCEKLSLEIESEIQLEISSLSKQLEVLKNSDIARKLQESVDYSQSSAFKTESDKFKNKTEGVKWDVNNNFIPSDWPKHMQKIGGVLEKIPGHTGKWFIGPKVAGGANPVKMSGIAGSKGHQAVLNIGKYFGVKFKPWGAVKIASNLSKAAKILGAVGGILGVLSQIIDDKQAEKCRIQLQENRSSIRIAYRDSAHSVESDFKQKYNDFSHDFYDTELTSIDQTISSFSGQQSMRKMEAEELSAISAEASKEIIALHQTISMYNSKT